MIEPTAWSITIQGVGLLRLSTDSVASFDDLPPKWICVENGLLFWYTDVYQDKPEGIAVVIDKTFIHDSLDSSKQVNNDSQSFQLRTNDFKILRVRVLSNEGVSYLHLKVPSSEAVLWFEVLNNHIQCADDNALYRLQNYEYENDSRSQQVSSVMTLTVKGKEISLSVSVEENVELIVETIMQEYNIKAEMKDKIENELLRCQIDACHIYQSTLLKRMSHFRRRLIAELVKDNRRIAAEKHAQNMDLIVQNFEKTFNSIETSYLELKSAQDDKEQMISQLRNDLARAFAENIELETKLEQSEESLRKKTMTLTETIKELKEKLRISTIDGDIDISPIKKPIPITNSGITSSAKKVSLTSKNSMNKGTNTEIIDLRREKALLAKQITNLQEQNKRYAIELQQEINKRLSLQSLGVLSNRARPEQIGSMIHDLASSKDITVQSQVDSVSGGYDVNGELLSRLKASEDRCRRLMAENSANVESVQAAKEKYQSTQQHVINMTAELSRKEDTISKLSDELAKYHGIVSDRSYRSVREENKRLKEQLVDEKGRAINAEHCNERLRAALESAIRTLSRYEDDRVSEAVNEWKQVLETSMVSAIEDEYDEVASVDYLSEANSSKAASFLGNIESENKLKRLSLIDDEESKNYPVTESVFKSVSNRLSAGDIVRDQIGDLSKPRIDEIFQRMTSVIEDRLLRVIYAKYNIGENGRPSSRAVLTLSRYVRFARDFEFISSTGNGAQGTFLVPGEVDMIFLNSSKLQFTDESNVVVPSSMKRFCVRAATKGLLSTFPSDETMLLATEAAQGRVINDGTIKPIQNVNRPCAGTQESIKFTTISSATVLTARQFIASVELLAIKVYAKDIEKKFGVSFESISTRKRDSAARFALDMVMRNKIIRIADRFDMIPWALIHFDETLKSISTQQKNYQHLFMVSRDIRQWFSSYVSTFDALTGNQRRDDPDDLSSVDIEASQSILRIPKSPLIHSSSPVLDEERSVDGAAYVSHIMSYKVFSKFACDFGIVPNVLKEPQLFNVFQEIIVWGRTEAATIVNLLPESLRWDESHTNELKSILFDEIIVPINSTKTVPTLKQMLLSLKEVSRSAAVTHATDASESIVGLTVAGFALGIATAAMQAFEDFEVEDRLEELWKWLTRSSGSISLSRIMKHLKN